MQRFISRYLSNNRSIIEIKEKDKILHYLKKNELWDFNLEENPELFNEFGNMLKENNICVGQVVKLHEFLDKEIQSQGKDEDEEDKENNSLRTVFNKILSLFKKSNNQNNNISNINQNYSNNYEDERKSYSSNSEKNESSDSERSSFNSGRNSIDSNNDEEQSN